VAEAIHQGLEMDRAERRTRMQRMRQHVMEHNIYRWAASVLGDLRDLRMETAAAGMRAALCLRLPSRTRGGPETGVGSRPPVTALTA